MDFNQDAIARMIIDSAANRFIQGMREDPRRSVRKLADLGEQFSKGSTQKRFFSMAQEALADENSLYYQLLQEAAQHIRPETLKTFGFNIGYNSCTKGARMIREIESRVDYNIPWSITFYNPGLSGEKTNAPDNRKILGMEEYGYIINQGKDLGIYTYIFLPDPADAPDPDFLIPLIKTNPDCAFVLFLPPETIEPQTVPAMSSCHNLMILVNAAENPCEALSLLKRHHCLYGVYFPYRTDRDLLFILTDEWLPFAEEDLCPFGVLLAGPRCPSSHRQAVELYVEAFRASPRKPIILMDFFRDNLRIDEIISDGPCFLGIRPDGCAIKWEDGDVRNTQYNVREASLQKVLSLRAKEICSESEEPARGQEETRNGKS